MYNNEVSKVLDRLRGELDNQQYTIATTRTETGYRRVRGAAGSGKSLALAARAAVLATEGKSVLVCTFNIVLYNYLRDLIEQFIPQEVSQHILFTNFHSWCKSVCVDTGYEDPYNQLWEKYTKDQVWEYGMADLVSEIYDDSLDRSALPTYDAILVDEGQDYRPLWWQVLRKAVVQGGEMLLVADKTQNVHGTAQAWTEETMVGLACGFTGSWMQLSSSYRLPNSLIPILQEFVRRFPYDGEIDLPERRLPAQIDLFHKYRWIQVTQELVVDACVQEIECFWNDPDILTVYFLSGKSVGISVVNKFKQRNANILSTHFEDWRESRDNKEDLHPGCAEICATTLQSFKGWEAPNLVVYVEKIESDRDRAVFYTALTRLKEHPKGSTLTVISSCPELEQFGREYFSDFESFDKDNSDFLDIGDSDIPF